MKNISCGNCGQEMSQKAPTCPKCGHPNKKANHLSGGQTLFYLIIGIAVIWWLAGSESGSGASGPAAPDPKQVALAALEMKDIRWAKGGFDSIMMLNATIQNSGTSSVKDIKIKCDHSSNSGTQIDSNTGVVYEVFPAGKSKKIKDFNMGFIHSQATSTTCRITDAVLL